MFRACEREVLLAAVPKVPKDSLNLRFKNPPTLYRVFALIPYTSRSQNTVIIVAV